MYKCPVCNNYMEEGWMPMGPYTALMWSKEPRKTGWHPDELIAVPRGTMGHKESVPETSTDTGLMRNIEAHICKDCKKVLLNYE
ncbi:MAG: PF20097 family protein [Candidatus Thermoplasmatota archaeon]|nr:PF20097 family protein [Candidatus Thermoplasmatota archaeon]